MSPSVMAWVCPGQGQQAGIELDEWRPMPEDPLDAHVLWEAMSACLGEDPGLRWRRLSTHEREDNLEAQWGLVLYQVLKGLRARASGLPCSWIVGYSAGELSAHALAGSLSIEALPKLVMTRARLMSEAIDNPGKQSCLVLLSEQVSPQSRKRRDEALQAHGLKRAILRSARESLWGALPQSVADFMAASQGAGWNVRALPITIPSHTPYLQKALAAWQEALATVSVRAPNVGLLAGVDGALVDTPAAVRDTLARQMVQPLEWALTLQLLTERGIDGVLDLGPGEDQWRLLEAIAPQLERIEI